MLSQEMNLTFRHGKQKPTLEAGLNGINVSHFASKTPLTNPKAQEQGRRTGLLNP